MSRSRFLITLAAVITTLGFSTVCTAQQTASQDLKYRLGENAVFTITGETKMNVTTQQAAGTITAGIDSHSNNTCRVLSTDDTSAVIEMEYGDYGEVMKVQTASRNTDFSRLTGKKVSFRLSSGGVVSDYKGFDSLPDIMTSSGQTLTEETFKLMVRNYFLKLSEKPVQIGDSWMNEETIALPSGGGDITSENAATCTVAEQAEHDGYPCLKIDVAEEQKMGGEVIQGGTSLKVDRVTKVGGTVWFAYDKGMILRRETDAEGKGTVVVSATGQEIPQTITSHAVTTVQFQE